MARNPTIFPILVDSTPDYVDHQIAATILQMPLGRDTVLSHFAQALREITPHAPRVVRTFEATPDYDAFLRRSGWVREASVSESQFWAAMNRYEPSDWILFTDAACLPAGEPYPKTLFENLDEKPRLARHSVSLAPTTAGTSERVEFDTLGQVRCVQRYYESVTWSVSGGVCSSLIPASSLSLAKAVGLRSLAGFRRALTALPSRDIPIDRVMDLDQERAFLVVNERRTSGAGLVIDPSAVVDPRARLVGDVIVHPGAAIEADAKIIGPSVIGAQARICSGSVVSQCVVVPGAAVGKGVAVRQRVVPSEQTPRPALPSTPEVEDPLDTIHQEDVSSAYPEIKRTVEAAVAGAALLVFSPLFALIALLIRMDSEGPVFYGDAREAMGGRAFRCFKFRTMTVGANETQRDLASDNQVDGPQFKMAVDPRVTRLGKFLRKTSLDELPQLFNVFVGQMSLVGPRPSPFRENQICVPWRDARLSVRPGITGLWQVCRHDRDAGDFHQWIYYDIEYIRNQSLLVDLKILAATLWTRGGKTHVPLSWILSSARNHSV